ncbi:adenylate/guanylate cyclase domain-containing protein [uncultured Tateyamaria sp.]|uniref:adenylate/guanylate cyclase domain-containing protein n=1 Tax=uncultured Tateyamaria sp. TaxID=455651 RepID=UPI0026197C52|nr:adenylate/guanylate cyclase domain-containing protein [uncultured Tateyamaria sp.]
MDRLKAWLESHSLGKHYGLFVEHSIDLEIIPELVEADFAELGLNLGDRKRVLRALRSLNETTGKPTGLSENSKPFLTAPASDIGLGVPTEKLHITMLIADLVGSTALSNELDLEEFRDVMHRYQNFAAEVIRRHHGHLAQFIGDAVTAYFGYPVAAEDDAERAVLAGLEICNSLNEQVSLANRKVQARVGIATGDLVVEDHSMREGLAFGDTPSLAARIMATTKPGTVAISERTQRLLGAGVECEWRGKHVLKGFAEPEGIWCVLGTTNPGLRFRARQKGKILPMVDRKDEMRLLESRWQAVVCGQRQTVLLSGEAGIGKSRLVEALAEKIENDGGLRLNFQCSVHDQSNAFFPLVSLINLAASIRRSDVPAQQANKLRRLLQDWYSDEDVEIALAPFASLLSIPAEALGLDAELLPEQLKPRLQQVLINLAIHLSDRGPVLLLFEDLHWVDPSTEELIDLLIERLSDYPIMILSTSRPEYRFRWTGLAGVTSLSIAPLENHYAQEVMRNALSGKAATPDIEAQIIRKSDGVPLFLEEMARMVRWRLDDPVASQEDGDTIALPSTLKDLLRAKFDNLAAAREIVAVCAAIGRNIYPSMVQAVTGTSFETARAQLDYLADVDILVPRGNQPDRSYFFRHALFQEAAYDLMLKSRARALHRKIAEVIAEGYPDLARQQPDVLAQHYTRADMPVEARDAWRDAATHAASRSATEETIRHIENALEQNDRIKDRSVREAEEITLRKMFNVALNTRAFGSRPVLDNMTRLHELLLGAASTPEDAFLALHVQFGAQLMLGDAQTALAMCDDFDHLAEDCADATMKALSAHNRGMATFMLGQFHEAIAQFQLALTLRGHCTIDDVLRYHAADIALVDMAMRCWARSLCSDKPDDVRAEIEAAVAQLGSEEHEFSRCFALNILATSYQALDDPHALIALVNEAKKVSDAHSFQYWGAWSAIIRGWARARTGEPTLGIAELTSGLDAYLATGSTQISQFARTLLADAYLCGGDIDSALATIERVNTDQKEGAICYHLAITARVEEDIRAALN